MLTCYLIFAEIAQVHWIHSYETLRRPNVLSVLSAVDLASIGRPKFLIYVSSVASLGVDECITDTAKSQHGNKVLETNSLQGSATTLRFGYAQSKWVAENLLHECGRRGMTGYIVKPSFVLGDSNSGGTSLFRINIPIYLTNRF